MKQQNLRYVIGLLLLLLFAAHASGYLPLTLLTRLEAIGYDGRVRFLGKPGIDPNIVIVDVDEKSLAAEGRWPWPRNRLAMLLDELFDHYQVRVVGFDMVFAEPDRDGGLKLVDTLRAEPGLSPQLRSRLNQMRAGMDNDTRFGTALADRSVVLGYYFLSGESTGAQPNAGVLPDPVLRIAAAALPHSRAPEWSGYGANLAGLASQARLAGHINYRPDLDGVSRRVPLLARFGDGYYEALSLAMVRELVGPAQISLITGKANGDYARVEQVAIGEAINVPVDDELNALVPYRSGAGGFTYVSAADVLSRTLDKQVLADKVILVGTTAPGLSDLRATPVSTVLPGVEVHANLISGMLDGNIKSNPPYIAGIELALVVFAGLLLALLLPQLSPLHATGLTVATIAAVVAGNWYAWLELNLVLPIASGVLLIVLLYGMNMSLGFMVETQSKKLITGLFGQYVPPDLVKEMSKDPSCFTLEGDSREMSVLFCDVRGFTTISEGMEPRELTQLMNEFLTPLSQVIYQQRGTIDKYIGDCVMAFWGAPLPAFNHATLAIQAALKMSEAMAALAPKLKSRGWPALAIGIGVNSGRMSVGNMGSEIRVAYTVMGDAVNLASRLEGITKQYGVCTLAGEDASKLAQGIVFREIDRVLVKGKREPITIYEPLGLEAEFSARAREELAQWHEALAAYRMRDWQSAESLLSDLTRRAPTTKLYGVFLDRIEHFRARPPMEKWDGVFAFETK